MEIAHTLFIYVFAIFLSWIWVDYYRLIDIYDKKKFQYILFTFALGFSCTFLIFLLHFLLGDIGFDKDGKWWEVALYATLEVGFPEEIVKISPLIITYYLFPKIFNEPIDLLGFATFSALGFAAAENILYIERYGEGVALSRTIIAVLSHTFDTALFAYGIILARYKKTQYPTATIFLFFVFAVLSHGFYDFWLIWKGSEKFGYYITLTFYLITVSIYSTILNNAINNSKFFSYKHVVNSGKITKRLFQYFLILIIIDSIDSAIDVGHFGIFFLQFIYDIFNPGFFIAVVVLRLSRFTLIEGQWKPIKLELPFRIVGSSGRGTMLRVEVKGEGYNETVINQFYQEDVIICPMSRNSPFLREPRKAYIDKKIFLKGDQSYYLTKFYMSSNKEDFAYFLLKPKTSGKTETRKGSPLAGLFIIEGKHDLTDNTLDYKDFEFKEWVYIQSDK